jgi:heme iron utilization protein
MPRNCGTNADGIDMGTDPAAFEARRLVRAAAFATLATQAAGQPFASLVTPAAAADFSALLWLSTLSEHTRQLQAEPRCALLYTGPPPSTDGAADPNPQTVPRVTLTGLATPVEGAAAAALKARWLARHPYAALYAEFGDFALWRVAIGGGLLVGGFARAHRLRAADLAPDPRAVAAIEAAAADIIGHVNQDHAAAVAVIAERLLDQPAGEWRMVTVDPDGADLAAGDLVCRLAFANPVADPNGVRAALVAAARQARAG